MSVFDPSFKRYYATVCTLHFYFRISDDFHSRTSVRLFSLFQLQTLKMANKHCETEKHPIIDTSEVVQLHNRPPTRTTLKELCLLSVLLPAKNNLCKQYSSMWLRTIALVPAPSGSYNNLTIAECSDSVTDGMHFVHNNGTHFGSTTWTFCSAAGVANGECNALFSYMLYCLCYSTDWNGVWNCGSVRRFSSRFNWWWGAINHCPNYTYVKWTIIRMRNGWWRAFRERECSSWKASWKASWL